MDYQTQLKIERAAVIVIAVVCLAAGFIAAKLEIATWTF